MPGIRVPGAPQPTARGTLRRIFAWLDVLSQGFRIASGATWNMRGYGISSSDAFGATLGGVTVVEFSGMKMAHASESAGGNVGLFWDNPIPLRGNAAPPAGLDLDESGRFYEVSYIIAVPVAGYVNTHNNGFLGITCFGYRGGGFTFPNATPANDDQTIQTPNFGITQDQGKWHWFYRRAFTNAGPNPLDGFVDISSKMPPNGTAFRVAFRFFPSLDGGITPPIVQLLVNGNLILATSLGVAGTGLTGQVGNLDVNGNNQSADGIAVAAYCSSNTSNGTIATSTTIVTDGVQTPGPTLVLTASGGGTLTGTAEVGDTFTIGATVFTVTAAATAVGNVLTVSVSPNVTAIAGGTLATYAAASQASELYVGGMSFIAGIKDTSTPLQ